jgi:hypothetical protein
MTDDEKHRQMLETFDRHTMAISTILRDYQQQAQGKSGAELLAIRTEENDALAESIRQQRRWIDHLAGRPVKPEVHFADAVIVGRLGGET